MLHAVFEGLDTLTSQFADALPHLGAILGLVADVDQQVPKRGHLRVDFGHQLQQKSPLIRKPSINNRRFNFQRIIHTVKTQRQR